MCQLDTKGGWENVRAARHTKRTCAPEEHKTIHQVPGGNRSARQRHAATNGLTLLKERERGTGRGGRKRGLNRIIWVGEIKLKNASGTLHKRANFYSTALNLGFVWFRGGLLYGEWHEGRQRQGAKSHKSPGGRNQPIALAVYQISY